MMTAAMGTVWENFEKSCFIKTPNPPRQGMPTIFPRLTEAIKRGDNNETANLLTLCRKARVDSSQILYRFEYAHRPIMEAKSREAAKKKFDSFNYDIKGDVIVKYEYDRRGEVSTVQLVNRTPEDSG